MGGRGGARNAFGLGSLLPRRPAGAWPHVTSWTSRAAAFG